MIFYINEIKIPPFYVEKHKIPICGDNDKKGCDYFCGKRLHIQKGFVPLHRF